MISSQELIQRIRKIDSLPSMPTILHPLLNVLRKPAEQVNLDEIVRLAQQNQVIAAQLLRMANSPLFPHSRDIVNLREAVVMLGLRRVRDLLLGLSLSKVLPPDRYVIDPVAFWRHSLGCALVCNQFATMVQFPDPDQAYLAGLLHDLGLLVNAFVFQKEFRTALSEAAESQTSLFEAERRCVGVTHCETGAILGDIWKLPADCVSVIRWHHETSEATASSAGSLIAIVSLCDLLCRARGMGYGYEETLCIEFASDPAWEMLVQRNAHLQNVDLVRLSFQVEDAVTEIASLVELIFPTLSRPAVPQPVLT